MWTFSPIYLKCTGNIIFSIALNWHLFGSITNEVVPVIAYDNELGFLKVSLLV